MPFYTTLQRDWELLLKPLDSYVFMIRNLQIHATKGQPIYPSSFIDATYRLPLRTVKRIAHPHFANKIRKFRRRKVGKFTPPCSLMWCTASTFTCLIHYSAFIDCESVFFFWMHWWWRANRALLFNPISFKQRVMGWWDTLYSACVWRYVMPPRTIKRKSDRLTSFIGYSWHAGPYRKINPFY